MAATRKPVLAEISITEEARHLNASLDRIQQLLADLGPRMEWHRAVKSESLIAVHFGRYGDQWQLSGEFRDEAGQENQCYLSAMSLLQKVELASQLPDFIGEYKAEQRRRLMLLAGANEALNKAMKMLEGE